MVSRWHLIAGLACGMGLASALAVALAAAPARAGTVGLVPGPASALAPADAPGPTPADSLGTGSHDALPGDAALDLPEDLQDIAAELDAADQPLPDALLREAPGGLPRGHAVGPRWPSALDIRWRAAARAGGPRHDGRLGLAAGPLKAKAAVRLEAGSAAVAGGGLELAAGRWRLLAGQVVVRHGLGLVAVDPGRRGSLAADRPLGAAAGGLALRATAGADALASRLGGEGTAGRWSLGGCLGRAAGGGALAWEARLALRAAAGGEGADGAVLARRDTSGTAVSLGGRLARGDLEVVWEGGHLPDPTRGGTGTGVAGATWRPGAAWRLEILAGLSTRPAARGASVLPVSARTGWAARLAWRARAEETLELLLQGARLEPDLADPRRRRLRLVEAGWTRRFGRDVRAALRLRQTERPETSWSGRAPWEPAVTVTAGARTAVTATLDWTGDDASVAAEWRTFRLGAAADGASGGVRQLMAFRGRKDLGRRVAVWVDAATAWGDDVDLVRAAQPLPGLVVARHWGDWASEVVAGASLATGPATLRAGVARRLPEPRPAAGTPAAGPALEGWVEARASW